jgi:hypothetical protein
VKRFGNPVGSPSRVIFNDHHHSMQLSRTSHWHILFCTMGSTLL